MVYRMDDLVIYTVIFGGYDTLKKPESVNSKIKYICFTDRNINCPPWEIVIVKPKKKDLVRENRKYKILIPDEIFNKFKYSIYLDGNFKIMCDLFKYFKNWLGDNVIAVQKHPWRNCLYDEAKECIKFKLDKEKKILKQIRKYKKEGVSKKLGLTDNSIIVRKHTEKLKKFNKLWWRDVKKYSKRDQISFIYAIKKLDLNYSEIPIPNPRNGNQEYFIIDSHEKRYKISAKSFLKGTNLNIVKNVEKIINIHKVVYFFVEKTFKIIDYIFNKKQRNPNSLFNTISSLIKEILGNGNFNPHKEAWNYVKKELFGNVCEITRKKPWGFKQDRNEIINLTVNEYLKSNEYFETIILHILSGEGEKLENIISVIKSAYDNCLKLVILEHNPAAKEWISSKFITKSRINKIYHALLRFKEEVKIINWGRNFLFSISTLSPLMLNQLNDEYYRNFINLRFVTEKDKGICTKNLIYTHTSELPLLNEEIKRIPKNKSINWVIGGGLFLETIPKLPNNKHKLIDYVFLQIIFTRYIIENKLSESFHLKISSLYDIDEFEYIKKEVPLYQDQIGYPPNHWRNLIKFNLEIGKIKNQIISIEHRDLKDLNVKGEIIYVSTVDYKFWKHLSYKNWIISALENRIYSRDVPRLYAPIEFNFIIIYHDFLFFYENIFKKIYLIKYVKTIFFYLYFLCQRFSDLHINKKLYTSRIIKIIKNILNYAFITFLRRIRQ